MQLEEKDKLVVLSIIENYKTVHNELGELEFQLADLNRKKDETLNTIFTIRNYEEAYTKILEAKYGPGKLDVKTMNWIKK